MEYRTIILDDDEAIRELLKLTATLRGHEVLTFSSPLFCSLSKEKSCPAGLAFCDMLISDQVMPGMTGLEFYEILKGKGCLVPNKALVTAMHKDIKDRADELGCYLIPKPFRLSDLVSWFEEAESKIRADRKLIPREDLIVDNKLH